ncbi:Gti1/Pac2 family-domain-containing protein [Lenzites betulinus]|nr:Gti1/Pac2 family-domain-containing protein [Lenzites betulinus]
MAMSTDIPLFEGFVDTTMDALRLIEAARRGLIPRVTRRLNDFERRTMIKSGAVFIFSVEESGIKRWTEGLAWSQSRISGNFLLYREVADRSARTANQFADLPGYSPAGHMPEPHLSYKPRGLIKKVIALVRFMKPPPDFARQQTITVKIDGSDYHLISYYTQEDLATGLLRRPTSRSDLMAIDIPPELTRSTNFRYPPNLEEAHDMGTGSSHRSDRDAIDNHPVHAPGPHSPPGLHSGVPPSPVGEDSSGMPHGHFTRHSGDPSSYYYHGQSRLGSLDTALGGGSPHAQPAVSPLVVPAQHRTHPYARRNGGPASPTSWHASVHGAFDTMTASTAAPAMYANTPYSGSGHLSHTYDERRGSWTSHAAIQSAMQPDAHRSMAEGGSDGSPTATSSWSPTGSPIHGPSLASAPPIAFSPAASLPGGRGRDHLRTRSYPSMQWQYDQAGALPHSSQGHHHAVPAYPIERGPPAAGLEHYQRYGGGDGGHSGR